MSPGGVVGNMPVDAMRPPHGLKPRYDLGVDWAQVITAVIVVMVLVAAAYALWRWWQWRKARAALAAKNIGDAAGNGGPGRVHELLARLCELTPAEPFDARAREEFYWRIGIDFRTAVEWRTGIGATSRTIRELRDPLRKKLPLPSRETDEAIALLEESEGIKFAGVPASAADAVAARDLTVRLIRRLFPGGA
jgi:hypothetical protein